MAEWSKALVLGTNHICGVGSNPTAANFLLFHFYFFMADWNLLIIHPLNTIHQVSEKFKHLFY